VLRFQNSDISHAIVSRNCVSGGSWPVRPNRNRTVKSPRRRWLVLCSWLLASPAKNRQGEEDEENAEQWTWDRKTVGKVPSRLFSGCICLHAIFSSSPTSIFHKTWNFFRNVERSRIDRRGPQSQERRQEQVQAASRALESVDHFVSAPKRSVQPKITLGCLGQCFLVPMRRTHPLDCVYRERSCALACSSIASTTRP